MEIVNLVNVNAVMAGAGISVVVYGVAFLTSMAVRSVFKMMD